VYAFTTWRGKHLYARVAPFAQCDRLGSLGASQRLLCDSRPVEARPGPEWYLWGDSKAPARTLPDSVVLGFAQKTIAHQPLDYAKAVAGGTVHAFYPGQRQRRREPCIGNLGFPDSNRAACSTQGLGNAGRLSHPVAINGSLASGLRWYARVDYPIGPVFLACVVLTLLALLWRPGATDWRLRLDAALFAAVGLTIMISAIATSNFNYRYTAVLYYTLPIAAAIAITQLTALRRAGRAASFTGVTGS
jgi:hypothetical protein